MKLILFFYNFIKIMSNHRHTLEPYKSMKSIHKCPNCEERTFTRYVDTHNDNKYLRDDVGKCSRLIKCNWHYPPKQYFQDTNHKYYFDNKTTYIPPKIKPKPTSFIPTEIFNKSIKKPNTNNFIHFLEIQLFGKEITQELIEKYKIGTSTTWQNATVFWQFDENERIRTGKIMLYDKNTCKRVKKPIKYIKWIHKTEKINSFNLEQCLFGLHLINTDKTRPIAIVESEKTAIISSIYLPEFIWLSCGGIQNLLKQTKNVLKGRDVILFPDSNGYKIWKNILPKLPKKVNYIISDFLEKNTTAEEKIQGYDIADYLINLNIDFKKELNI